MKQFSIWACLLLASTLNVGGDQSIDKDETNFNYVVVLWAKMEATTNPSSTTVDSTTESTESTISTTPESTVATLPTETTSTTATIQTTIEEETPTTEEETPTTEEETPTTEEETPTTEEETPTTDEETPTTEEETPTTEEETPTTDEETPTTEEETPTTDEETPTTEEETPTTEEETPTTEEETPTTEEETPTTEEETPTTEEETPTTEVTATTTPGSTVSTIPTEAPSTKSAISLTFGARRSRILPLDEDTTSVAGTTVARATDGERYVAVCTGTILAERYILTTASCAALLSDGFVSLREADGSTLAVPEIPVERVIKYAGYSTLTHANNMAVVKTSELLYSPTEAPRNLPVARAQTYNSTDCAAASWDVAAQPPTALVAEDRRVVPCRTPQYGYLCTERKLEHPTCVNALEREGAVLVCAGAVTGVYSQRLHNDACAFEPMEFQDAAVFSRWIDTVISSARAVQMSLTVVLSLVAFLVAVN